MASSFQKQQLEIQKQSLELQKQQLELQKQQQPQAKQDAPKPIDITSEPQQPAASSVGSNMESAE